VYTFPFQSPWHYHFIRIVLVNTCDSVRAGVNLTQILKLSFCSQWWLFMVFFRLSLRWLRDLYRSIRDSAQRKGNLMVGLDWKNSSRFSNCYSSTHLVFWNNLCSRIFRQLPHETRKKQCDRWKNVWTPKQTVIFHRNTWHSRLLIDSFFHQSILVSRDLLPSSRLWTILFL
jgi:hypothetical protein